MMMIMMVMRREALRVGGRKSEMAARACHFVPNGKFLRLRRV